MQCIVYCYTVYTVYSVLLYRVNTEYSVLLYRVKVRGIYEINNGGLQDREAVKKVRRAVNPVDYSVWCGKHYILCTVW